MLLRRWRVRLTPDAAKLMQRAKPFGGIATGAMRIPAPDFCIWQCVLRRCCPYRRSRARYPWRPVTMVVPYGAGGPADTIGPILAEGAQGWSRPKGQGFHHPAGNDRGFTAERTINTDQKCRGSFEEPTVARPARCRQRPPLAFRRNADGVSIEGFASDEPCRQINFLKQVTGPSK